ncbi:hypothetical protein CC1G_04598 [Coprinopsis cinerea okayama7|uniref:Uncharacterized protein n=1 Tax=Coprinopsis cinerea (strain Okayama-7 / 130 / ATCC MYA-4618 / FGSC 9003) TaxID=240176 RepID=A8N520_COPC7|nr:hypothetical protein CC1G_04598 [Coprinopsis cinerea okayama7\|eukprot:XP_001829909.2 hypothetical protein CC1G_04598 [Coprinopsis cinerea okayama7\
MAVPTATAAESMDVVDEDGGRTKVYKGKVTHRSWAQLPEEIVRYIATYYLLSLASTSYNPQTWETRDHWQQRMVYTVLRDGGALERNLMSVCMGWHKALQNHLFWQQAVALIDPTDYFLSHMWTQPLPTPSAVSRSGSNNRGSSALPPFQQLVSGAAQPPPPVRISFWKHLRSILAVSCYVCRINAPPSNIGLGSVHHSKDRRTTMFTPYLGWVNVCRDHERRKAGFCGLCLREAPIFESATANAVLSQYGLNQESQAHAQALGSLVMSVACIENEDEETWPNVEATCRTCRLEWLWRKTNTNERDREAVAGGAAPRTASKDDFPPNLAAILLSSEDWETRQTIECFLDLGEGTINDVLCLAREKWWLRKFTKLGDMMQQALAARRWNGNTEDMSGRASPARGYQDHQHQSQQVVLLEEAATITSRTLSSSGSDNASEMDREETHYDSADATPDHQRRPILREVTDDYESLGDEEESLQDDDEDDDEDAALLQREENSVKELALGDWARARILDGYWISPADTWYNLDTGYPPPSVRYQKEKQGGGEARKGETWTYAVHPCPWTVEKESDGDSSRVVDTAEAGSSSSDDHGESWENQEDDKRMDEEQEDSHPRWSVVTAEVPPSYTLCEQAFLAHQKQLRLILLPAMRNIVRKLVMECGAAATSSDLAYQVTHTKKRKLEDPAIIASRMSMEEVVRILREEEGVWFDGVDWIERMKNREADEGAGVRKRPRASYDAHDADGTANEPEEVVNSPHSSPTTDDDDRDPYRPGHTAKAASASSGSGSGTSPVLSTTTLETTPSPPMAPSMALSSEDASNKAAVSRDESIEDGDASEDGEPVPKILIPVAPVLEAPRLLRPIPYVPTTVARFPQYTMEALKMVWREACVPLFHCRCSICQRAAAARAAAEAKAERGHHSSYVPRSPQEPRQYQPTSPIRRPVPTSDQPAVRIVLKNEQHEWQEEVQEVDLNELEFDSDEVVEIVLPDQHDGGGGGGGVENAAYYFPREREQHQQQRGTDDGQPKLDAELTLTDEELRAFGYTRSADGGLVSLEEDDNGDGQGEIVQSPLPSEDIGDTTSNADSPDSGNSSRKRSCDELEGPVDLRVSNDPLASPKRARLATPSPVHVTQAPQTPRKRPAESRLSPPRTPARRRKSPALEEAIDQAATPPPRLTTTDLEIGSRPMIRKRNSEELEVGDGGDADGVAQAQKKAKLGGSTIIQDVENPLAPPDLGA